MSIRNLTVFGMALLGVCACFLTQQPPAGTTTTKGTEGSKGEGVVVLEELQGEQSAAAIFALFAPRSTTQRGEQNVLLEPTTEYSLLSFRPLDSLRDQSPCQIKRKPREGREDRASSLVSAGRLSFGTALQSSMLPVDENNEHRYFRKLDVGIPASVFNVKAEGSEYIPAFEEVLSMPEVLNGVQFTGPSEEDGPVKIMKNGKFKLSWKSPAFPSDANIMLVDVYADTANESVQLHCVARESDLSRGGLGQWTMPAELLSQLPTTNESQVFLVRANARTTKDRSVEFQGLRSFYSSATVE